MNLDFGNEYEDFRNEVKAFCEEFNGIHVTGSLYNYESVIDPNEKPKIEMNVKEWQKVLIDKGYHVRHIPKEYGGFGGELDIVKNVIITEEFSKSKIPTGVGGQGIDFLVPTLMEMGTEEQRQKYIRPALNLDDIWCQGYSEPNAGSDLASLQTKGELVGDEWIINGQKIWTSTAKYAQMMFCLVRTEPNAPKHQGISYLLIPMDTPGIEVRPLVDMTLDAGFNEVFFTDVRIPAENIVGKRGQGWLGANKTLVHERGSLGDPNKMIRRYDKLVNLMKSEILDGVRISDKPIYRDRLMKIQGKILALKSHGLRLLSGRLNKGQDLNLATMIVKLYGTEMRYELESLAIDAMGEIGTLYENSPHLRDNGGWQYAYMYYLGLIIGGGTSQIQKNIISERGLGLPKEPKIQGV